MLIDLDMGNLGVHGRKAAIVVSSILLVSGWYRSPEKTGASELASKQIKLSTAVIGSKKVSSADFNAALPRSARRGRTVKTKKIAISFEDQKTVRPSTTKFFNKMRVAEKSHGDLPIDPPAPTSTPTLNKRTTESAPKRPRVWEAYEDDIITRESEESLHLAARVKPRTRTRFRTSSVTLIPTGGMSYSQFDVSGPVSVDGAVNVVDFNARPGYSAGVLLEAGRGTFSIQTGLVYIQEGVNARMTGTDTSGIPFTSDTNLKVNYIGLPILAKISTGYAGETRVSIKGGVIPVYGTNLDTETSKRSSFGTFSGVSNNGASTQTTLRQFNVLGQVGAGIVLPSGGNVDFRFDVLYTRGLMTLHSTGDTKMYTQSWMGMLGLGIPL